MELYVYTLTGQLLRNSRKMEHKCLLKCQISSKTTKSSWITVCIASSEMIVAFRCASWNDVIQNEYSLFPYNSTFRFDSNEWKNDRSMIFCIEQLSKNRTNPTWWSSVECHNKTMRPPQNTKLDKERSTICDNEMNKIEKKKNNKKKKIHIERCHLILL